MKKNYNYNTRAWEERNGVYQRCVVIRENNLSKAEWTEIKNDMSSKGTSISNLIVDCLRNYLDNKRKGGK